MTKIKNIAALDVYGLFHCAVTERDAAHIFFRSKQYKQFTTLSKASAVYLAQALLAAKGISVTNEKSLSDQLSSVKDVSDAEHKVYDELIVLLSSDAAAYEGREYLKRVYRGYQSTLIDARKILVHDLAYNENIRQKLRHVFFTLTGLKKLALVILPLIVLILLPITIYHYVDPIDSYQVEGQLFWKTRPNVPFNPSNSKRFPVILDNQTRQYMIEFDAPVNIFLLRLDPVNRVGVTDVEIESIHLHGSDNKLLRKLVFDNSMYWSCHNCTGLEKNAISYRMQPTSNDPYLTSLAINIDRVSKISITMRSVSKKTFWEWILGIDKNLEF